MTETRNHIMDVARSQFFKTGYAGTSINSIVDATKFTKPTVYYHFKNKAELFASLVHDAYDRCFEHRQNAVDALLPVSEQLYQVIAADFAFCLANPDLVRFVVALTFALPEDHSIDLSAIHSRDHESFRALIERGISTGEFDCADAGDTAIALQGLIAINIMAHLQIGHDVDRDQPLKRYRRISGVRTIEFSGTDPAFNECAEGFVVPTMNRGEVNGVIFREGEGKRHDKAHQIRVCQAESEVSGDHMVELLRDRKEGVNCILTMFKTAVIGIVHQRGEEFSLIFKVVIDGGFSEPRRVNDGVDRRTGVARLEKLAPCYVHNVIACLSHRMRPVQVPTSRYITQRLALSTETLEWKRPNGKL